MALTSLQACMDSSDWLQDTIGEDSTGMDSSSQSLLAGDILTCSRPLMERRLRPQHDQALKCPRCDSTHTKFCYYNNYSLSQPRYFCKTCRRYWTKGGTLRNIPVGGGCRKNKKVSSSSKKSNSADHITPLNHHSSSSSMLSSPSDHNNSNNNTPTDLHLSFPHGVQMQFTHFTNMLAGNNPNFVEANYMNENPAPIDFMEGGFVGGGSRINHDFLGNGELGMQIGGMGNGNGMLGSGNFHGVCSSSPFGMSLSENNGNVGDPCQRLMLPYYENYEDQNAIEAKPNPKVLSLEWHDATKDSFGYNLNGVGSWTGLINGFGSSATNPLV